MSNCSATLCTLGCFDGLFLSIWFDLWKALNVYTNVASLGDDFVLLCLSCLFLGASDFFASLSVVLCSLMCGSLPSSVSVIWLL